jgi:hypothetical protein
VETRSHHDLRIRQTLAQLCHGTDLRALQSGRIHVDALSLENIQDVVNDRLVLVDLADEEHDGALALRQQPLHEVCELLEIRLEACGIRTRIRRHAGIEVRHGRDADHAQCFVSRIARRLRIEARVREVRHDLAGIGNPQLRTHQLSRSLVAVGAVTRQAQRPVQELFALAGVDRPGSHAHVVEARAADAREQGPLEERERVRAGPTPRVVELPAAGDHQDVDAAQRPDRTERERHFAEQPQHPAPDPGFVCMVGADGERPDAVTLACVVRVQRNTDQLGIRPVAPDGNERRVLSGGVSQVAEAERPEQRDRLALHLRGAAWAEGNASRELARRAMSST